MLKLLTFTKDRNSIVRVEVLALYRRFLACPREKVDLKLNAPACSGRALQLARMIASAITRRLDTFVYLQKRYVLKDFIGIPRNVLQAIVYKRIKSI